jgi:hypothetical protein
VGDTISAYYRATVSNEWTFVGRETLSGLTSEVYVGLAVSSHVDGTLATATFDNVSIDPIVIDTSRDVGAVGVAGSMRYDGVLYEIRGSGADIWGTADAFHLAHHLGVSSAPVREITARVRSIGNTHQWAKAGVMFRESALIPPSPHVMVVVTPGRGVAMQYRTVTDGPSMQAGVRPGSAPEWVRLTVEADLYTGYASDDGVTWHVLGQVTIPNVFTVPGLAVTSHNNAALTTAIFENLELKPYVSR